MPATPCFEVGGTAALSGVRGVSVLPRPGLRMLPSPERKRPIPRFGLVFKAAHPMLFIACESFAYGRFVLLRFLALLQSACGRVVFCARVHLHGVLFCAGKHLNGQGVG